MNLFTCCKNNKKNYKPDEDDQTVASQSRKQSVMPELTSVQKQIQEGKKASHYSGLSISSLPDIDRISQHSGKVSPRPSTEELPTNEDE